jgi:two-component system, LytTR family, sensor kinase
MIHPVFTSKRTLFVYLTIWIVIIAIHIVVLHTYFLQNLGLAIGDALVFNLLYALMGLAIWYPVAFSSPEKKNILNLLINLITSLLVLLLFWGGLSYLILTASIPDADYQEFIRQSIPWRIVAGTVFYMFLVLIFYLIIYYNHLHQRKIDEAKLRGSLKEAELDLLKSQINPHFLFNSLNSISSLTITDSEKAQEMLIKLSDFLRYTIRHENNNFTNLKKEIENIKRYLDIEKIRFGSKLQFEFNIEDSCLECQLPLMILQPLFENAIKHGVYESNEPIIIRTLCVKKTGFMEIKIHNNFQPGPALRKGAGLGLKNIRERLGLLYHSDQLLSTHKGEHDFEAKLLIPEKTNE